MKKLALNKETLVALQPDVLAGVNGGDIGPTGTTGTTGTNTRTTNTSIVGGCPSRILDTCITKQGPLCQPTR